MPAEPFGGLPVSVWNSNNKTGGPWAARSMRGDGAGVSWGDSCLPHIPHCGQRARSARKSVRPLACTMKAIWSPARIAFAASDNCFASFTGMNPGS